MGTTGAVVNGRIEMDQPEIFPEGTKVWIGGWDVTSMEEADEDGDYPIPPPDCTYEEHLQNLRESFEEAKAGKGRPFFEVMQELSAKHGLPPFPTE